MKKDAEAFLQKLLNTPSPSGFEQDAALVFRNRVADCADEVVTDVHGNTLAILNPSAPFKFMLAGHIDEVGLMILHIDDKGFLYIASVGGMDAALLVGQRVRILGAKGPVDGVIGRKPIHLMQGDERTQGIKMESLWVDIGAASRKEAEKAVAVGDVLVVDVEYRRLREDRVIARGCDDKAGAFVVAETLRALAQKELQIGVIGVATVQEEVGLRGATTSAYAIRPQAAIAVDVNFATDHPETDAKRHGEVKLGGGPNLHRGPNINPVLGRLLEKTARAHKIPFQVSAEPGCGGCDAGTIQLSRGGVATAIVSIPNRYMHTPVEMVSLRDLEHIVELLTALLSEHPAQRDYRPGGPSK